MASVQVPAVPMKTDESVLLSIPNVFRFSFISILTIHFFKKTKVIKN
jgi:hypothetical protein